MAERPVFVPNLSGGTLVRQIDVHFQWHPGMAASQKKKNIAALHRSAASRGLTPLLEISSKSDEEIGRSLSAFNLKLRAHGSETTLECAFQGSKVFERGGPYQDLYFASSREAKRDPRLRDSGKLIGFRFEEEDFSLSPATAFYDWLFLNALFPHKEWLVCLQHYAGFTDIEFNPKRSVNCQAKSCAAVIALYRRARLEDAIESFGIFSEFLQPVAP